jgi:predicted RNA-binding protein with PIN domain
MVAFEARLLGAAIVAARKVLRDLDEEQLPASLRPVAASAARKLPPPLANALIRDLDRYGWLRERAVENWPEITEASEEDAGSAAFLLRPDGWEHTLDGMATRMSEQDLASQVDRLSRRVRDLEYQLGVEKERVEKIRGAKAEAERRARRESAEIAARVQEATRAERVSRLAAESRLKELQRASSDARADLVELDDKVAFLKEELLRARRAAADTISPALPDVWTPRDPAALASMLDQLAAAAVVRAVPEHVEVGRPPAGLSLPSGVRPDGSAAVDWLLEQSEPFVMIVDGYNLAHQWTPQLAREDLNHRLARLRRLANAPVRLVVIYDSGLAGGGQSGPGPGGIDVRFTDEGMIADEEIMERAASAKDNVVVVSSDREVREGSPDALCLWSQAVREWFKR